LALLVFTRRVEKGDQFPPYSSWRADPGGSAALYDALPAVGVEVRRLTRVDYDLRAGLPEPSQGAVLRLGQRPTWGGPSSDLRGLLEFARDGGLVLVAYRGMPGGERFARDDADDFELDEDGDGEEGGAKNASPTAQAQGLSGTAQPLSPSAQAAPQVLSGSASSASATAQSLSRGAKTKATADWRWRGELGLPGLRALRTSVWERWATAEPGLPGLPSALPVRGVGAFKPEHPAWRALYKHAGGPVVLTRAYGKGRLVAFANGYLFSNEGVREQRPGALLSALLAGRRIVVFDERGLGVYESPGLNEISWRLGLGPLYGVLLLLALLWLWRRLSPLLAREERDLGPEPLSAGGQLSALLRGQGSAAALLERLWRDAQARPEAPFKRRQAAARIYEAWATQGKPSAGARKAYQAMVKILTRGEKDV
jgi:hypothetical protein